MDKNNIFAAKGIISTKDGNTKIGIANLGHESIVLRKGTVIGKCQAVNINNFSIFPIGDLENPTKGQNSRQGLTVFGGALNLFFSGINFFSLLTRVIVSNGFFFEFFEKWKRKFWNKQRSYRKVFDN
jgi:hypothetical protein